MKLAIASVFLLLALGNSVPTKYPVGVSTVDGDGIIEREFTKAN